MLYTVLFVINVIEGESYWNGDEHKLWIQTVWIQNSDSVVYFKTLPSINCVTWAPCLTLLCVRFLNCKTGLILLQGFQCDTACKWLSAVLTKHREVKSPGSVLISKKGHCSSLTFDPSEYNLREIPDTKKTAGCENTKRESKSTIEYGRCSYYEEVLQF